MPSRAQTAVIENVTPLIDGGRYPVKRIPGEPFIVEADLYKDGHDVVSALLKWRKVGDAIWSEVRMEPIPWGNDRWRAQCAFPENAMFEWTVEVWGNLFSSWQHEFSAKFAAGEVNLTSEALEGANFIEHASIRASDTAAAESARLLDFATRMRSAPPSEVNALAHEPELERLMWTWSDRSLSTEFVVNPAPAAFAVEQPKAIAIPMYPRVFVDRSQAVYAAWYEFFPRSADGFWDRGSTFRDCLARVDDAKAMGFDVIYFPPIHPIGMTARKGRNNSLTCDPGDPGVPYAIGNRFQGCGNGGGHKDVAPELGTLDDFNWLVSEIRDRGMEVALDFAINCSPDHPYVHEHPDWFYKRPDGTIKYAENPPKKYQDVYPMNYHCPDWRALWDELTSVIEFWCEHDVRIFRVDNPHTKPVAFWEYLIGRVQKRFPDAIFLSEAFTKPKMMRVLAKVGFTQSYTYFTWRNTKQGLTEYFTELSQSECAEYMRGNLFPNTPDILPSYLQFGGRPAFLVRSVLATMLSSVYGIYSGFELCENVGLWKSDWQPAGDVRRFLWLCDNDYKQLAREEYQDSEKYHFKWRDWNAQGNIKEWITKLNHIRKTNPALREYRNLRFGRVDNDVMLYFWKATPSRDNVILVVVNLDAWHTQSGFIELPLHEFGLSNDAEYEVHDLLHGETYQWQGPRNYVELHPEKAAHVMVLRGRG